MIKKEGIPYSISATYYSLNNKYWFGITMISAAALLMPAILEKTPEHHQWVAFLALVGMIMVGVSPNFKDGFENKIHMTGAIMCVGFSQLWVLCMSPAYLLLWGAWIGYTIYMLKKNWTGNFSRDFVRTKPMFWVEIVAEAAIFAVLIVGR